MHNNAKDRGSESLHSCVSNKRRLSATIAASLEPIKVITNFLMKNLPWLKMCLIIEWFRAMPFFALHTHQKK